MRKESFAIVVALLLAGAGGARGQGPEGKKPPEAGGEKPKSEAPAAPRKFVSHHHVNAGGVDIAYTATAEDIDIRDDDGKPTARFFTISYSADGTKRPEDRPVTFVFNGGPGSSSIFLHFGFVGPKRIDIPSDASDPGAPPYRLQDNPSTLLRATDLVMVDPVGTGFSHALGEKKNKDFWGYEEDADSVAELIRAYITLHNRWNSPKYILGESYGGIRTSMLVPRLQQNLAVGLNGVILISPAINMGALPFVTNGNDLTYATHLPSLAAAAFYHHKLPDAWPSLDALMKEVEAFASKEYLEALFRGDALPAAEKSAIADQLRRYTGLSKTYILNSDLRVFVPRFAKELLREEGKAIGLLDARYAQKELDNVAAFPASDPFDVKTSPIYVALFNEYLHDELAVDVQDRFNPQNGDANQTWKRPKNANGAFAGFVDETGDLAQGTKDNEALRVFVANGYYDLATGYYASRYMLTHSGIEPGRLTMKSYEGGHMMYLVHSSLETLSNDVVTFIRGK